MQLRLPDVDATPINVYFFHKKRTNVTFYQSAGHKRGLHSDMGICAR